MSGQRPELSTAQKESAAALRALQEFEVGYLTKDLDAAIQHARASVSALPDGDEDRAGGLTILAVALQRRYQTAAKKDIHDIEESVQSIRQSLELRINGAHTEDPSDYFENMTRCLKFYCTESGNTGHIAEAVKTLDEIIPLTPKGGPYRALALKSFCEICDFSYERTKELQYLERGKSAAQTAVSIIPEGHPLRQVMLEKLHDLFDESFLQIKSIQDLDGMIRVNKELLSLKPEGDSNRLQLLHNLAVSFDKRYGLTNDDVDSEEAIANRMTAVKLALREGSNKSVADRLAALKLASEQGRHKLLVQKDFIVYHFRNSLYKYIERTGNIPEIDEEVLDAIHVTGFTPEESTNVTEWRSHLGDAFERRYEQSGRLVDLEFAVLCVAMAMQSTNDSYDGWEELEDAYRKRYRLWSEHTGKMPESEITLMMFGGKNSGSWIPPELEGGLGLSVPYMISPGDLPDDSEA